MTLRAHRPTDLRIGGRPRSFPTAALLLVVSLLANGYLLWRWTPKSSADDAATAARADGVVEGRAAAEAAGVVSAEAAAAEAAVAMAPAVGVNSPVPVIEDGKPRYARIVVDGPVSNGFVNSVGPEYGGVLAITTSRVLSWFLDVTKDPRKGDVVDVVYRRDADDLTQFSIDAVRYRSAKFGRTFEAYRFQPKGWTYASHFDKEGREIAAYLADGPIVEYQEITSLIGDGRGHKGMDFKTPVGTPVRLPFDGVIKRTNWNWRYNGNSIEVRASDGKTVRFLHLDELPEGVEAGKKVKKGEIIARSGNTGRSFAPHLHYELFSSGGKLLDPLDVHTVQHRQVGAADLDRFEGERGRLVSLMGGADGG